MPSNVTRFEWLYYISLGVFIAEIVLTYDEQLAFWVRVGLGNPFILATHAVTIGIYVLLIRTAARARKNWARWVLLFLFVIGLFGTVMQLGPIPSFRTAESVLGVIYILLQGFGLFLIFTGNAQEWFRKPEPAA